MARSYLLPVVYPFRPWRLVMELNAPGSCDLYRKPSFCNLVAAGRLFEPEFHVREVIASTLHGCDAWRFEHFRLLLDHDQRALEQLFRWCADLVAGRYLASAAADASSVPGAMRSLLSAARLVASAKPAGGVRPIAIGSCLRRLAASAAVRQLRARFAAELQPLQFGVAVHAPGWPGHDGPCGASAARAASGLGGLHD